MGTTITRAHHCGNRASTWAAPAACLSRGAGAAVREHPPTLPRGYFCGTPPIPPFPLKGGRERQDGTSRNLLSLSSSVSLARTPPAPVGVLLSSPSRAATCLLLLSGTFSQPHFFWALNPLTLMGDGPAPDTGSSPRPHTSLHKTSAHERLL